MKWKKCFVCHFFLLGTKTVSGQERIYEPACVHPNYTKVMQHKQACTWMDIDYHAPFILNGVEYHNVDEYCEVHMNGYKNDEWRKYKLMKEATIAKFQQNESLRTLLLKTEIENNDTCLLRQIVLDHVRQLLLMQNDGTQLLQHVRTARKRMIESATILQSIHCNIQQLREGIKHLRGDVKQATMVSSSS